jgi:hypothetical protein
MEARRAGQGTVRRLDRLDRLDALTWQGERSAADGSGSGPFCAQEISRRSFPSIGEYQACDDNACETFTIPGSRNAAYLRAIAVQARGQIVLDLGTGRDALWALAAPVLGRYLRSRLIRTWPRTPAGWCPQAAQPVS